MIMDFVDFELAKKLKEKGLREECLCHYIGEDLVYNIESPIANNQLWFCHNKYDNIWHIDNYDAPTISQVLKWFREEKKIHINPVLWSNGWYVDIQSFTKEIDEDGVAYEDKLEFQSIDYETYEEAVIAGIEYVLNKII